MSSESRRNFLATTGKLLVGTVALGSVGVQAAEEHAHMHGGSGNGLAMAASSENMCATCQFWGGMRKISKDRKEVVAQSMGWCNNPKSMSHQKLTAADRKMKKPGIWQKWAVL